MNPCHPCLGDSRAPQELRRFRRPLAATLLVRENVMTMKKHRSVRARDRSRSVPRRLTCDGTELPEAICHGARRVHWDGSGRESWPRPTNAPRARPHESKPLDTAPRRHCHRLENRGGARESRPPFYPSCGSSSSVLWARGGVRLMAGAFCGLEPGACFAGIVASRGVDRGTPCERDATWTGSARVEVPCSNNANATRAAIFRAVIFPSPPAGTDGKRRAHPLR